MLPAVTTPMVTLSHSPETVYTSDNITLNCTIELDPAVNTAVMVTAMWTGPDGLITGSDFTMMLYESTLTLNLDTAGSALYGCNATVTPIGTPFVMSNNGMDSETITIRKCTYIQSLIVQ